MRPADSCAAAADSARIRRDSSRRVATWDVSAADARLASRRLESRDSARSCVSSSRSRAASAAATSDAVTASSVALRMRACISGSHCALTWSGGSRVKRPRTSASEHTAQHPGAQRTSSSSPRAPSANAANFTALSRAASSSLFNPAHSACKSRICWFAASNVGLSVDSSTTTLSRWASQRTHSRYAHLSTTGTTVRLHREHTRAYLALQVSGTLLGGILST